MVVPGNVAEPVYDPITDCRVVIVIHSVLEAGILPGHQAKLFLVEKRAGKSDDGKFLGKQMGLGEVIECGQQRPPGQVSLGSKDDDNTRIGNSNLQPGKN